MSTIDEHLATLEMCNANSEHDMFCSEAYLMMQVHWADLIVERSSDVMSTARATVEQRIREQLGERAEQFINKWREARAKETA
jgi:hypothetical protein